MHTYTPEQRLQFARVVAKQLNENHSLTGKDSISSRTVRKARQGNLSSIIRIQGATGSNNPNIGQSITMADMAKNISTSASGKKKIYCTDGSLRARRESQGKG